MMEIVVSSKELVDRPFTKRSLHRLMHLKVDLIPEPVVQHNSQYKNKRSFPGDKRQQYCHRSGFYRRFVNIEANLFVLPRGDRLIGENLEIVLMMSNGVGFKIAPKRSSPPAQETLLVHQLTVHLVFYERHQNTGEYKPAANF